jgi:hypothetical protein
MTLEQAGIFLLLIIISMFLSWWRAYQNRRTTKPAPPVFPVDPQINYEEAFRQAVAMAGAGRKPEAYQWLKSLERSHPNDISLLLWLAFTTPDRTEAEQMIVRAEQLDRRNPDVILARQWFSRL